MSHKPEPLAVDAASVERSPIRIPGATPGGIEAQLLNIDLERGIVATIIHFKPGAEIPAHFHELGAEAHFVLEGDLIDGGRTYGPGAYLTHAAGVVHGPHRSEGGCRVLTVQGGKIAADDTDFHLASDDRNASTGEAGTRHKADEGTVPPDMEHEPVPEEDLLESQKTAPTPDNPTNPSTG
jgi:quercetin dioxygenase-like cupin family protein